jgi:DNA sulfur modification protein DndC
LEGLAEFRDWLKEFSRQCENRMNERRNGNEGMGPLTTDARRTVLSRLQQLEQDLDLALISEAEVRHIEQIWRDDESLGAANKARRLLNILGQE